MIAESSHRLWLDQNREEVLDPDMPIVDAHHHLWHGYGTPVPWQPDYWIAEQGEDIGDGHNIVATVFVECGYGYANDAPPALRPVGETRTINAYADRFAEVSKSACKAAAGIVAFADLTLGAEVDATLEAHLAAAPDRFRGIRQITPWDPSPEVRYPGFEIEDGMLLSDRFKAGFSRLQRYGLSFDAWLFHPQIPEITELARQFPDTTIILDHFGGPIGIGPYAGKSDEVFRKWKQDIAQVAKHPNVFAKLGGLWMEHAGFHWHGKETPPSSDELAKAGKNYFHHTIDLFGPERCMFESNFPVDKLSCSYRTLWNSYKKLAAPFSPDERKAMFHDTARNIYRLDIQPEARHIA